MKKYILLLVIMFSQFSEAQWITSFGDAQKLALASNKFMIVDFWATWCGPCKKMEYESWSDAGVNELLNYYVQVKIDIDDAKDIAGRYGIESIPDMLILDGNGKVIYNFSGYHSAEELKNELKKVCFFNFIFK